MNKGIRPLTTWLGLLILPALACSLPGVGGPAGTGTPPAAATPTPDGGIAAVSPTPDSAPVEGVCANPLLPVVLNASWTYHGTGGAGDLDYTYTVTEVLSDGFTSTAPFTNYTISQRWICKPEGLLLMDSPSGSSSMLDSAVLQADFQTTSSEGITLPAVVREGDEWSSTVSMSGTVTVADQVSHASTTAVYQYRASGLEEVTVPAGVFLAWKIELTATITTVMEIGGVSLPTVVTETGFIWMAPGVGKVRSEATNSINGIVKESTEVLLSYEIP